MAGAPAAQMGLSDGRRIGREVGGWKGAVGLVEALKFPLTPTGIERTIPICWTGNLDGTERCDVTQKPDYG